jgi:hypothetical protein
VLNEFVFKVFPPRRVAGSLKVAQLHLDNFRTWFQSLKMIVISVADSFTAHAGSSRLLVASTGILIYISSDRLPSTFLQSTKIILSLFNV